MSAGPDESLTLRTWRRGSTPMATADVELAEFADLAVVEAVSAARRRWPELRLVPATLLVSRDDLLVGRAVLADLDGDGVIADVRQVNGLRDPGWAVSWPMSAPSGS